MKEFHSFYKTLYEYLCGVALPSLTEEQKILTAWSKVIGGQLWRGWGLVMYTYGKDYSSHGAQIRANGIIVWSFLDWEEEHGRGVPIRSSIFNCNKTIGYYF